MGFINYNGTKEDRYLDVLDFARSQQEEEQRQVAISQATKRLTELTGTGAISELNANELLKFIIIKYRKLASLKASLAETAFFHNSIDIPQLWADFSLWIIEKHLNLFNVPYEVRSKYLITFYNKVFKVPGGPPLDAHMKNMLENSSYNKYFAECFDLSKGKYYWKWLRDSGDNASNKTTEFNCFIETYFDLVVHLTYYLFLSFVPPTNTWISELESEKKEIEDLKARRTMSTRFKVIDTTKLVNPVYKKGTALLDFVAMPRLNRRRLEGLDDLLKAQSIPQYIQACKLVISCDLPEQMHMLLLQLCERLGVLYDTIEKSKDVYQPDLFQFYEYYIPEAIRLTASFLEYVDARIGQQIIDEAEKEVMTALDTLVLAVNEKIDEVYTFAAIDIKAAAQALDAIMNQDGFVDSSYTIN